MERYFDENGEGEWTEDIEFLECGICLFFLLRKGNRVNASSLVLSVNCKRLDSEKMRKRGESHFFLFFHFNYLLAISHLKIVQLIPNSFTFINNPHFDFSTNKKLYLTKRCLEDVFM